MKYFPLVWSSLMRRRARTFFTLASIAVAFLLFGMLDSVRATFVGVGSTALGASQMITLSKMGLGNSLPIGLQTQIENVPGVATVTRVSFFGGFYQKPANGLGGTAVGKGYFAGNPAFTVPPAALKAFQTTQDAMLVDERTAKHFGWKAGDRIPVVAPGLPTHGGNDAWTFELVGIFNGAKARKSGMGQDMIVRWKYVDAEREFGHSTVDWYEERLANPATADRVAHAIDALTTNSDHETRTQTLNAFISSLVSQAVNIGLIVAGVMVAVFFTLILLTGNTMAQAVRERIPELAVLKTIGFRSRTVMTLVLGESMLMVALGGTVGMLLATAVVVSINATGVMTPPITNVGAPIWGIAIMLMLAIGLIVGILPALRGMRLRIVDALAGR